MFKREPIEVRALLVVGVLLLPLSWAVSAQTEILEQVLVRVNGELLTKSEFENRQVSELRQRPELAGATIGGPELQRAIAEITPELILEVVDEMLLVQRGREQGWSLGDEQFNQIVTNIKTANNLEDEERFREALRQEGMTMADLRRNLERQMLASQVQRQEVFDKVSVREEEALEYYQSHQEEFTTPSQITLREIFLEVPTTDRGVNVAVDDEARALAEGLHKRLLDGEPFPRLAGEYSAAPSKANGGLIGPLSSEDLAPQLRTMLDGMQVGDVTDVLRTPRGYQILMLESRTETLVRPFDDARTDISRRVAELKATNELLKYLERLREQASIVWRNDELRKAYDQALSKRRQTEMKTE
jgi:peptidyl-prolyl cis-trans isomerase SurA